MWVRTKIPAPSARGRTGSAVGAAGTLAENSAQAVQVSLGSIPARRSAPSWRDKHTHNFGGREYVLEEAIKADVSIVKAWKGDRAGNLVYRKTSRNFNPMIATCGKICVAEVEELVEVGALDPDQIHTPGIFVDRIIQGPKYEKRIEFRTVSGAAASKRILPSAT